VQATDVGLALSLFETHERLSVRDATLAAVALNRGVEIVLSADRDFDGVPGIERVDPRDAVAVASLYVGALGGSPANSRARTSTASIIGSVSRPVNVFCWLGW
jgi:hypothetical protein